MTSKSTILLSLATDFLKIEARILDFGDVGVQTMELVMEMIMEMISESTGIGDRMVMGEIDGHPLT